MANLNVNNDKKLRMRLNRDEYWDFFISNDSLGCFTSDDSDNCLMVKMDLNYDYFDDSDWIYSDSAHTWQDAVAMGHTLYNITYTGVDNGLFRFRKDRIMNKDFFKLFQENSFDIIDSDYRLKLHSVSGNTMQYEYPIITTDEYTKFNGGFFQGFFKTECDKYYVFPSKFNDGEEYNFEFVLKKSDLEKESEKTLNDKYPENKGIFFYIGTRAENKWIYLYDDKKDYTDISISDFVDDEWVDNDSFNGSLLTPNPTFDFDFDDYTDYHYYKDSVYQKQYACDFDNMFDYLEINSSKKAVLIDETMYHTTITDCKKCNSSENFELVPYFNGCACGTRYKKVMTSSCKGCFEECDEFGGDYIGDFMGLNSLEDDTTYLEDDLDISDFDYELDCGIKLSEANSYYFKTDNKFLIFDRTKDGKTVSNWEEGTEYLYVGRRNKFKGNLFILMNRTKTGYTVHNIDELRDKEINSYNVFNDLYDNALAFRITDKGEIGYRLLTIDCQKEGDDKTLMMEGYSNENVIPNDEWISVNVKAIFLGGNKMKFMFYVNGKLKFITKELPRIRLRKLDEIYEKQEGVPFNISLGGGTQGLCDTIQYNYMAIPTRVYPLEKYFGGSFIGYMKSFNIYGCKLSQEIIYKNFITKVN